MKTTLLFLLPDAVRFALAAVCACTSPHLNAQAEPVTLTYRGLYSPPSAPGGFSRMTVADRFVYLTGDTNLAVYDVSQPNAWVHVSSYATAEPINDVQVVGRSVYLAEGAWPTGASTSGALEILDLSNPAQPARVGYLVTRGSIRHVRVVETLAYLPRITHETDAEPRGVLEIFDLGDPAKPVLLGGLETGGPALDVQVAGRYAYLADGVSDLVVLDVSDPAKPERLGSYSTNVFHADSGFPGGPARQLELVGGYVWALGPDGLHVLNVSDPTQPTRVGGFIDFGLAVLRTTGGYAFISVLWPGPSGPAGYLLVLDPSSPADPPGVGGVYEPLN